MKIAIGYARKSNKDQSNFSVPGQKEFIDSFCVKNAYNLRGIFCDDGRSASTFDRPDWVKLEAFIKKYYREIDYLVVCKYDRFSRNAAQGLEMIETLERRYNIVILSVLEYIPLPPESPYFFKLRASMLVDAEYELRVIKDRTIFGIYHALKSGRHVHQPPFGYMRIRDDENKCNIDVDPAQAEKVRQLIMAYYMGATIAEVNGLARRLGITLRGKMAMQRMLANPTYAGLIRLPAYKDAPEKMIKGSFPGIISEAVYNRVQDLIRHGNPALIEDARFPLRGVLKCHCGRPLTAAFSKGKSKYYPYYKCPYHAGANYSATKMHGQFDDILHELSLSNQQVDYTIGVSRKKMQYQVEIRSEELKGNSLKLKKVLDELESLEEKYFRNKINDDTYSRWAMKLNTERIRLQNSIDILNGDKAQQWAKFEANLPKLTDVYFLYNEADLLEKKNFVRLVFDNSLYYEKPLYRTPFLHPIFALNELKLKEKGLLIKEAPIRNIPARVDEGAPVEHFDIFMDLISKMAQ